MSLETILAANTQAIKGQVETMLSHKAAMDRLANLMEGYTPEPTTTAAEPEKVEKPVKAVSKPEEEDVKKDEPETLVQEQTVTRDDLQELMCEVAKTQGKDAIFNIMKKYNARNLGLLEERHYKDVYNEVAAYLEPKAA